MLFTLFTQETEQAPDTETRKNAYTQKVKYERLEHCCPAYLWVESESTHKIYSLFHFNFVLTLSAVEHHILSLHQASVAV